MNRITILTLVAMTTIIYTATAFDPVVEELLGHQHRQWIDSMPVKASPVKPVKPSSVGSVKPDKNAKGIDKTPNKV